MDAKERLRALVDALPEHEAEHLIAYMRRRRGRRERAPRPRRALTSGQLAERNGRQIELVFGLLAALAILALAAAAFWRLA
jgi:hypothetical protein